MKVKKNIDLILQTVVSFLLVLLVLNVLWQVVSRFIIGHPSTFTDELAGFLLIWVGLLGAAYATGQKQHLAINLLNTRFNPVNQLRLAVLNNVLIILFAIAVMLVGGINLTFITLHLHQVSSALKIPVGLVYVVIPVSGLLIIFYAAHEIYILLKSRTVVQENSNLS